MRCAVRKRKHEVNPEPTDGGTALTFPRNGHLEAHRVNDAVPEAHCARQTVVTNHYEERVVRVARNFIQAALPRAELTPFLEVGGTFGVRLTREGGFLFAVKSHPKDIYQKVREALTCV